MELNIQRGCKLLWALTYQAIENMTCTSSAVNKTFYSFNDIIPRLYNCL